MTRSTRHLTWISLVLLVVGGNAGTAHAGGNGHNNGNGTHNKTTISYDSPTINHGIQHVTDSNAGGNAVTQNAFCKKRVRLCKIREHLIINDP
jgi:hypothetical protein